MIGSSHTVSLTFVSFPQWPFVCVRHLDSLLSLPVVTLALRETLIEHHVTRSAAGLQGVNYKSNLFQRVPLHICSVNGNLCVNKVQGQGQWQGAVVVG